MWLVKRGVAFALVLTTPATVGLTLSGARAQDAPHPDHSLAHVFHHICEFPQLAAILRAHEISGADAEATPQQMVCTIGDFPFQAGEVHFELYAAPEVDDLWLADESDRLRAGVDPTMLLRLHREESDLVVDIPGRGKMSLPREYGEEDRLVIRMAAGKLELLDKRHNMRPVLDVPLEFARGLQLLIPCDGPSCGPETCGLPALDLYLAAPDASRWTAAGLSNMDRARE